MVSESEKNWPVLIVEDDVPTAELESRVLLRCGKATRIVHTANAAVQALHSEKFSAVLLDYMLVNENGWSVLEAANALHPVIPVIVVTGRGSEEVAVEALRLGAADYIIKNDEYWEQLPNIVERVITMSRAERLRACLASVAEAADDAIVGADSKGAIVTWNSGATRIFGYNAVEIKSKPLFQLFTFESQQAVARALVKLEMGERLKEIETEGLTRDKNKLVLSVLFSKVNHDQGGIPGISMVARDISERKHAEVQLRQNEFQLRQLQKYEAIREISGGVAHEFNNLLTVMMGRCELIQSKLGPDHPVWSELDLIVKTGERAAAVSRNLLAYSRQQQLHPRLFRLNDSLNALVDVLKHLAGKGISVEMRLTPEPTHIFADPVKIDEVIINLVKNATDAMPTGGTIVIETTNVVRDDEFAREHQSFKPGKYTLLSVSDTGTGMDDATRARIFEPFFTTKGRARRTGLGLAMVYGTVKQSDGFIYVTSELQKGSRFELYFPGVENKNAQPVPDAPTPQPASVKKTILIVDDEPILLELVNDILDRCGYTLLSANGPSEALKISKEYPGTIDLLLTDIVMPEMNGSELSMKLCSTRPGMKVLYMSGYPESHLELFGAHEIEFLPKPFSFDGMRRKVQQVLEKK